MSPSDKNRSTPWSLAGLTILFLLALLLILEGLARLPYSQQIFPYRSVDNYHYQFELKWFRLQEFARENGGLDILFVGSSLVNTGVDPAMISKVYFEKTGLHARIFNFGVEGLTVSPNSVLASLLVDTYHPALIVFITEMRDYIAGNGLETETNFLSDHWLRYKLGKRDLFGWLIDHSAFLQIYLPYRNWVRSDFPETMAVFRNRFHDMSASGYEADNNLLQEFNLHPDPNDPHDAANFREYGNYQLDPGRLQKLLTIIDQGKESTPPTSTLVVEMPIQPVFYIYVGGDQVHQEFQSTISSAVESNGGYFLPSHTCLDVIPADGRSNLWHLNFMGAPYFSSCLGKQLALLADQQNTSFTKDPQPLGEVP